MSKEKSRYWFWDDEEQEWYESEGYGVGIEIEPDSNCINFVVIWGTPEDRNEKRDTLKAAAEFASKETN